MSKIRSISHTKQPVKPAVTTVGRPPIIHCLLQSAHIVLTVVEKSTNDSPVCCYGPWPDRDRLSLLYAVSFTGLLFPIVIARRSAFPRPVSPSSTRKLLLQTTVTGRVLGTREVFARSLAKSNYTSEFFRIIARTIKYRPRSAL